MFLKKSNGFSLIEVIVSIAVIAIIGVMLSGFISSALKAKAISQDRLKTLSVCTSYLNEIKSNQEDFSNIDELTAWLGDKGFTTEAGYFEKTENNVNIKLYINQNLNIPGLFELEINGKAPNASDISISTVIKGGK